MWVTLSPAWMRMATIFANAAFVSAALHCFLNILEHSWILFFAKSVIAKMACAGTQWSIFTYTFAQQGTHDGFGCRSDVVRICSDVVSDVDQITWDLQETSLRSRCRP